VTSSNGYVIIGIDPGLMTGLFVFRTYAANHTEVPQGPLQVAAEQIPALLHDWIIRANAHMWDDDEGTEEPHGVYLAVEKFIITPKTAKLSQQTDALEVTGMVKAIAAIHEVFDVRQYAKANLKFANDDMLRAVGWFDPKMRHANDAARQAFALLKDVDYPRWSELVRDASMEPTTEG
jgi:hypothetical protein